MHNPTSQDSVNTSDSTSLGVRQGPIVAALVLAVCLVIGVLVGARVVFDRAAHQPVVMGAIDSKDADSAACASLIEALPEELVGLRRAEIAEPVPPGAAAWQRDSLTRISLRCGVQLPLQYSHLSTVDEVSGTKWLEVADTTPDSTRRTWYSVNRTPAVAVTLDDTAALESPLAELAESIEHTLTQESAKPNPIALLEAPSGELSAGAAKRCDDLLAGLPDAFGTQPAFERMPAETFTASVGAVAHSAAWTAKGYESIVVRCGVGFPESYAPGAQLQQINDIPWFEDTTLGNGTTASTWFALGRDLMVAVSAPQEVANTVLVNVSRDLPKVSAAQ